MQKYIRFSDIKIWFLMSEIHILDIKNTRHFLISFKLQIWKNHFSNIIVSIFWYQKWFFWYLKFKLISWYHKIYFLISRKTNHFWSQKNHLLISRIRICDIKNWFSDIKNQNSWYQENKLFIAIKNINFDIHIINSKFFFNIRNWFLDIKIWILDIRKWFFDIKISIFWYLEFFFCIKNSNYWYQ